MPDELEGETSDGSSLRKFGEEQKARADTATQVAVAERAHRIILEKGLNFVKVADLEGTPLDDVEAKALSLQADKVEPIRETLRTTQGLEGEPLEVAVQEFLGGNATQELPEAGALSRVGELGRVESQPTPLVDASKLHGDKAMSHELARLEKKRNPGRSL